MGSVAHAASGGPRAYCIAYAGNAATGKTGIAGDGHVTDERWLGAYNKAFNTCMDSYSPQPPDVKVASGEPDKRKHAKQRTKPKRTARRAKPAKAKPAAKAPPRAAKQLCRRMLADQKGSYRIRDCTPPKR